MRKEIDVIPGGCPVCGDEVRGNDDCLFLCLDCFIYFQRRHLKQTTEKDGVAAITKIDRTERAQWD